ncbi:MAG: methyltransferase domain-containing protein [Planctomycetes bacterium]|nr:methyltransferase domain-containing protein [Planctomycetota bacterium]
MKFNQGNSVSKPEALGCGDAPADITASDGKLNTCGSLAGLSESSIVAGRQLNCPSCLGDGLEVFYEARRIPVQVCVTMGSRQEALDHPCRDLALGYCRACGFITNVLFEEGIVCKGGLYEDQQTFSPFFRNFQIDVTRQLVERYGIRDKDVVEIGCGKGDFLHELCKAGDNRGLGIDPLSGTNENTNNSRMVRFVADYFGPDHAKEPCDLLSCRHTLEHIRPVSDFLTLVRSTIGDRPDTLVYFEVPDTMRVMRERAFWDIYYDHCSYFTSGSFARLFRSRGFDVINLARRFGEQYLLLFARPTRQPTSAVLPQESDFEEMTLEVAAFGNAVSQRVAYWRNLLLDAHRQGRRIAIWGSGSKCVGFLSTVGMADVIDRVIDVNPRRHGRFLPGLGCPISAPEELIGAPPDVVIVMNPVYQVEIRERLAQMGVTPEILTI